MNEVWDESNFLYTEKHQSFARVLYLLFSFLHSRHINRYLKSDVLKSIVRVIKHANFQCYLQKLTIGDKYLNKQIETIFDKWKSFKMIKNVFYFMLKALSVLEIFTFLSWGFGYVEKRLDKKVKVNSKIYDVTDRTTNNYNTHIVQYLKKWRQSGYEIWSVNKM